VISIMIMSLAKLADVACNFCGDGEFSETAWLSFYLAIY